MKYKYSAVNNRLIPADTAELVLAQELGREFVYTEIICKSCENINSKVQDLLDDAVRKEINCSFDKTGIIEMYEKVVEVNSIQQDSIHIILAGGRKDILFIGKDKSYFKNES